MANPEHLAIFEQGIEVWNRWREKNPDVVPDFSGTDLSRADLHGADFCETNLRAANLIGADLRETNLRAANLMGADLRETNLRAADLRQTYLIGANLSGANLIGADLSRSDLRSANLHEADLSGTNLTVARNLNKANLSRADLHGADFCETNLRAANLHEANLMGADLRETNLRAADLRQAYLIGANLSGANLHEADLSGSDLHRANLHEANLYEADLSGSNLHEADLSGTKLSIAMNLNKADLSRASLREVHLGGADLREANLRGADLIGAYLIEANLIGADLREVDLREVDLREVDLRGVDLRGANLSGTDLHEADLRETDLRETDLSKANLRAAGFYGAKLSHANLGSVDLRRSDMIDSNLDGAVLTGTKLWESRRSGWSIKGVICEYAYFDREGKEKTGFKPGEFEKLYSEKTRIVLHYKDTMNTVEIMTLPALIKTIESENPGSSLRLESIKEEAGGVNVSIVIEDLADNEVLKLKADAEQLKNMLSENQALLSQAEGKFLGLKQFMLEAWRENMVKYNVEGDVNGPLGDGASMRDVNIHKNDLSAISKLISDLLAAQPEIEKIIPTEKAEEFNTAFEVIEEQASAKQKDWKKLKKGAQAVKNVLDGVGDTAGKWMPIVEKLSDLL